MRIKQKIRIAKNHQAFHFGLRIGFKHHGWLFDDILRNGLSKDDQAKMYGEKCEKFIKDTRKDELFCRKYGVRIEDKNLLAADKRIRAIIRKLKAKTK